MYDFSRLIALVAKVKVPAGLAPVSDPINVLGVLVLAKYRDEERQQYWAKMGIR